MWNCYQHLPVARLLRPYTTTDQLSFFGFAGNAGFSGKQSWHQPTSILCDGSRGGAPTAGRAGAARTLSIPQQSSSIQWRGGSYPIVLFLQTCVPPGKILDVSSHNKPLLAAPESWRSFRAAACPKNFAISHIVQRAFPLVPTWSI